MFLLPLLLGVVMSEGTFEKPWQGADVQANQYYGKAAVQQVEKNVKTSLTLPQKRIVELEGYVPGYYLDHKKNKTYGVGQTGEFMKDSFLQTYNKMYDRAEDIFGVLGEMPEELQAELVQVVYRGDAKKTHTWVEQFNNGYYKKAADSLLVHREYMDYKKEGIENSITRRLEAASKMLIKYDGGFGDD